MFVFCLFRNSQGSFFPKLQTTPAHSCVSYLTLDARSTTRRIFCWPTENFFRCTETVHMHLTKIIFLWMSAVCNLEKKSASFWPELKALLCSHELGRFQRLSLSVTHCLVPLRETNFSLSSSSSHNNNNTQIGMSLRNKQLQHSSSSLEPRPSSPPDLRRSQIPWR